MGMAFFGMDGARFSVPSGTINSGRGSSESLASVVLGFCFPCEL